MGKTLKTKTRQTQTDVVRNCEIRKAEITNHRKKRAWMICTREKRRKQKTRRKKCRHIVCTCEKCNKKNKVRKNGQKL